LRELHKELGIVVNNKKKRLDCIVHVGRMDQGRRAKKIFESKPEVSTRRGRPSFRRLEDVGRSGGDEGQEMETEGSR
jgi:hypothetical protein